MRALLLPALAVIGGCWKLDPSSIPTTKVPFTPDVGAPEGWWIEGLDLGIDCPDRTPARYYVVYPADADRRIFLDNGGISIDATKGRWPIAVVFGSGAFDYELVPGDTPLATSTWHERDGEAGRLDLAWGAERVLTQLGVYPNYGDDESHAGSLAAALATKGIVSVWPVNCWGDHWHNKQGDAENDFREERFFREGRSAAELATLLATDRFPTAQGLQFPVQGDPDRQFLVGLGEGARAVGELLSAQDVGGAYAFGATAAVVDSPVDDLGVYTCDLGAIQAALEGTISPDDLADRITRYAEIDVGLDRIFPDEAIAEPGEPACGRPADRLAFRGAGRLANVPAPNLPGRLGILVWDDDPAVPPGANDRLFVRYGDTSDADRVVDRVSVEVWVHRSTDVRRPVSNASAAVSKAVADFLAEGLAAVDPDLVQ